MSDHYFIPKGTLKRVVIKGGGQYINHDFTSSPVMGPISNVKLVDQLQRDPDFVETDQNGDPLV